MAQEIITRLAGLSNPYAVLGVAESATQTEVRKAYLKLSKRIHPDKCNLKGAKIAFQKINKAHKILKDPETREKYDIGELDDNGSELSEDESEDESTDEEYYGEYGTQPMHHAAYAPPFGNAMAGWGFPLHPHLSTGMFGAMHPIMPTSRTYVTYTSSENGQTQSKKYVWESGDRPSHQKNSTSRSVERERRHQESEQRRQVEERHLREQEAAKQRDEQKHRQQERKYRREQRKRHQEEQKRQQEERKRRQEERKRQQEERKRRKEERKRQQEELKRHREALEKHHQEEEEEKARDSAKQARYRRATELQKQRRAELGAQGRGHAEKRQQLHTKAKSQTRQSARSTLGSVANGTKPTQAQFSYASVLQRNLPAQTKVSSRPQQRKTANAKRATNSGKKDPAKVDLMSLQRQINEKDKKLLEYYEAQQNLHERYVKLNQIAKDRIIASNLQRQENAARRTTVV